VVSRRTLYWRWQRNSPLDIHHGQAHWGVAPCSVLARTGFEWRSQRDCRLQAVEWYRVRASIPAVNLLSLWPPCAQAKTATSSSPAPGGSSHGCQRRGAARDSGPSLRCPHGWRSM